MVEVGSIVEVKREYATKVVSVLRHYPLVVEDKSGGYSMVAVKVHRSSNLFFYKGACISGPEIFDEKEILYKIPTTMLTVIGERLDEII